MEGLYVLSNFEKLLRNVILNLLMSLEWHFTTGGILPVKYN